MSYFARTPIEEKSTAHYSTILKDKDGQIITDPLTAATASIYDASADARTAVSGWSDKDVNETGGGTFDTGTGIFSLVIPSTANAINNQTLGIERRVLELTWTLADGSIGRSRIVYLLRNFEKVS